MVDSIKRTCKRNRINLKVIDRDMLKFLAIIPMTIGHFCSYLAGEALYQDIPFLSFLLMHLAVFAPPIFFFFIAEGFRYTHLFAKWFFYAFYPAHLLAIYIVKLLAGNF